jgi:hypothetical protein
VTCTASDACHVAGTCSPSTGTCSNPAAANGTACSDGNACTQSDTCQGGTCTGSNPVTCTASDPCHVAGTCDPGSGACSNPVAANGTACSDGNACTLSDTCQGGTCTGSNPVVCQPLDACHTAGMCDPGSGQCSNPPIAGCGTLNPSTVDRTVASNVPASTSFLYSGASPVQTGVASGTIVPATAAVVRGHVFRSDGSPLPGVAVTIAGHPELGSTVTQSDGGFDMAVNGGQPLRVRYTLGGYLTAERLVRAPWQDYVQADDVVMMQVDAAATAIDLSNTTSFQVARGTAQTDTDGTRRATVLVPPSTQALMTMPDGTMTPLSTMTVRATEYTVGSNGPSAMPAPLPPTSAYTYAVELSADEALSAGATRVTFSQSVPFYLENFLGFTAGTSIPAGSYDKTKGAWVAEANGVVIQIVSENAGTAQIDVNDDGAADTGATQSSLGITSAELGVLAELYETGQSLWRITTRAIVSEGASPRCRFR